MTFVTGAMVYKSKNSLTYTTRGPWTTTPALIRVGEKGKKLQTLLRAKEISNHMQFFGEKVQQRPSKVPFLWPHHSYMKPWIAVRLRPGPPPSFQLSAKTPFSCLVQWFGSQLVATQGYPTPYFLLAPMYQFSDRVILDILTRHFFHCM